MATTSGKRQPYEPNRSCEQCRGLKIRCLQGDSQTSSTCQRCVRLNLECVYAPPAKRRPRKRTDTKVAELEKEVRMLSSILRRQFESSMPSASPAIVPTQVPQQQPKSTTIFEGTALQQEASKASPTNSIVDTDDERPVDLIQSGLVSYELAQDIFDLFVAKIIPSFPVLAFAADVNMEDVRAKRPILFFSIIASASVIVDSSLALTLHEKLASFLAVRSMVAGSSVSLDLLQALLVATFWFFPGETFDRMKYQQYAYAIAAIASQISSAKRSKAATRRRAAGPGPSTQSSNGSSPSASESSELESLELPRTLISCFLLCSGISRSLHRPSMFPFTRRMSDYLHLLSSSPNAVPSDRLLILWAQQQHIMCESVTALGVDDPSVDVDIAESRTQQILQTYDNQLEAWYSKFIEYSDDPFLRFFHFSHVACLHEIALYCDHDPDDFKPPFAMEKLSPLELEHVEWTAAHTRSISLCWISACKSLDLFLEMRIDLLRLAPVKILVRVVYCVVLMLKVSASAKLQSNSSMLEASLEQEYPLSHAISYIDRCVPHLQSMCEGGRNPMAEKMSFVLGKMKNWSQRHEGNEILDTPEDDLLEPMQDLAVGSNTRKFDETHILDTSQNSTHWTEIANQPSGTPQDTHSAFNSARSVTATYLEGQPHSASHLESQWQINEFSDFDATHEFNMPLSPSFFQQHGFDFPFSEPEGPQGIFDWADFDRQETYNSSTEH